MQHSLLYEAAGKIGRSFFPYGNMCRGASARSSTHGRMETPGCLPLTPNVRQPKIILACRAMKLAVMFGHRCDL
jgi:hypothetical protein